MPAQRDDVVGVASLRLGDDVVGGAVLELAEDGQLSGHGSGRFDLRDQLRSVLQTDPDDGDVWPQRAARGSKGTAQRAIDIIVDDRGDGVRFPREDRLLRKGAGPTLDERDLTRDVGRVVLRVASNIRHERQLCGDDTVAAGAVRHGLRVDLLVAVDRQVLVAPGPEVDLLLLVDIVVARPAELVVDEVDGVLVRGAAEDTVPLGVGVGKVFELLGAREEVVEFDQGLQRVL